MSELLRNGQWQLLTSTFAAVFLAELGDKTQLATMSLASTGHARFLVFIGAASALVAATALAVLLGGTLGQLVPELWIKRAAGIGFLVMGVLMLTGKL
jgi:putative Ca2+/H+ antiporter (TMEM165/GDT1 family)